MHLNIRRHSVAVLTAIAVSVLSLVAAGCGDDATVEGAASQTPANGVDLAFAREMVPHHESAIEMAKVAERKGQHDEIKRLADDIQSSQSREITQLKSSIRRLEEAGVKPGNLGMEMTHMDAGMLADARPFDREFIDMMVPHHRDAVTMAQAELKGGKDPELRRIAEAIIAAQEKEIGEMNAWRTEWYGAPVKEQGKTH